MADDIDQLAAEAIAAIRRYLAALVAREVARAQQQQGNSPEN